jgi:hypothetical protein
MTQGTSTPNAQLDAEPAAFNPAQIKEFTPQNYDMSQTVSCLLLPANYEYILRLPLNLGRL